jgi:hypothetical protein
MLDLELAEQPPHDVLLAEARVVAASDPLQPLPPAEERHAERMRDASEGRRERDGHARDDTPPLSRTPGTRVE